MLEKEEKWLFGLAILLLITDLFLVIFSNIIPKIVLEKGNIILNLNDVYEEPGYHASKMYLDLTDKVLVKNNINTKKIGTYKVTYTIIHNGQVYQKVRYVSVLDQVPPTITLNGSNPAIVCPHKKYEEEGYQAIDNYDGNLTKEVIIETNPDYILYSVKDQSGNFFSLKRNIKFEDNEAPIITLNGGNAYSLYVGETYLEPGYTATDNCDGEITSKVIVTSNVDTNKIGTYEIIYEVTDSSSKSAKTSRKVVVLGPKPTNNKIIYLTFDDGPSFSITPELLDILKEENVKATFFVLNHGSNLDYLIKREYEEGHTVALHGSSHNYKQIYSSSNAFFDDLSIIQNKVEAITGEKPMIIRFPGGSSNTVSRFNPGIMTSLTREVKARGFHYFDWNVGSGDAGEARTPEDVYSNVINSLGNKNNVVLMHDYAGNYKTLNAIRKIIRYGKNNGYTFAKITMDTPEVHHRIAN